MPVLNKLLTAMLISPELAQPLMMIAGLAIICWLLLRGRATRSVKRLREGDVLLKHNANTRGHSLPFSGVSSLGAPVDVLKWQVELHELGRELKAELDSKLIAVRAMTQAYDEASNRLIKLLRAADRVSHAGESLVQRAQQMATRGDSLAEIADSIGIEAVDLAQLLSE